jgi:glycosyltransferase involved in cell wall biosynthesis
MSDRELSRAAHVHVFTAGARSGIAAYAADFHRLVLEPEGYVHADPREVVAGASFNPGTVFHIQLGVFQHRERLAMSHLWNHGYEAIEATLHDPPFLTFPYFQFGSELLMRLSRGFDWYLNSLGLQRRKLERLSRIFVLSETGRQAILDLAPAANVITIPHVIRPDSIWPQRSPLGSEIIYFGFIGPGKGLDYVLRLHRELLRSRPGTQLHVVGQATSRSAQHYIDRLKAEYRDSVTFHGYVPDEQLDVLFERAGHAILPYAQYKYVFPASGSAIHAIRRARILWTTDANAMAEVVKDGENGFRLAMNVAIDARRLADVLDDEAVARRISDGARRSALQMAQYPYRDHFTAHAVATVRSRAECRAA